MPTFEGLSAAMRYHAVRPPLRSWNPLESGKSAVDAASQVSHAFIAAESKHGHEFT